MRLDNFDKLEDNIKKSIKFILDLKTENNRLKKEVELLRKQRDEKAERIKNSSIKEVNSKSMVREAFPKDKSDTLVSQLDEVIKKMKNFSTGVEF